jgi:type VI secretion system secreted protein Hcp
VFSVTSGSKLLKTPFSRTLFSEKQETEMTTDSYLQIDGLKGESTDSGHKDWIEILSYSHSITMPESTAATSAGGGTVGRSEHGDFVITKYIDLSSPKLYEMCSSGKHIKKVTIELMRASGDAPVKYIVIEMDQAVIAKLISAKQTVGSPPIETVSFHYGVIKWTYL